jgi:hypothetical protein
MSRRCRACPIDVCPVLDGMSGHPAGSLLADNSSGEISREDYLQGKVELED